MPPSEQVFRSSRTAAYHRCRTPATSLDAVVEVAAPVESRPCVSAKIGLRPRERRSGFVGADTDAATAAAVPRTPDSNRYPLRRLRTARSRPLSAAVCD